MQPVQRHVGAHAKSFESTPDPDFKAGRASIPSGVLLRDQRWVPGQSSWLGWSLPLTVDVAQLWPASVVGSALGMAPMAPPCPPRTSPESQETYQSSAARASLCSCSWGSVRPGQRLRASRAVSAAGSTGRPDPREVLDQARGPRGGPLGSQRRSPNGPEMRQGGGRGGRAAPPPQLSWGARGLGERAPGRCPPRDSGPGVGTTTRTPTLSSRTCRCGPLVRSRQGEGRGDVQPLHSELL